MKKKFMITAIVLAVAVSSFGVTFGSTKGGSSLKSCFADLYKIFSLIYDSTQNWDKPEGEQGGNEDFSKPEEDDTAGDNRPEDNKPDENRPGNGSYAKAQEILNLVNEERSSRGLSALTLDSSLNEVAQLKAEDMAENRYFSHNSPTYGSAFDMLKEYGIRYNTAGENIAKGQKSSQAVMTGWMNSQGHRENILKKEYSKLGVGYATDKNGNTYWVQIFIG